MKMPLAGGEPTILTSAAGYQPGGMALDRTNVYWTDKGLAGGTGTVMRMPLDGGATETLASGLFYPVRTPWITNLYWTSVDEPPSQRCRSPGTAHISGGQLWFVVDLPEQHRSG